MSKPTVNAAAIGNVVMALLSNTTLVSATKYLSPTLRIRATAQVYRSAGDRHSDTIAVTIGKPNYAEGEFIKKLKQAGEPFPVRKVQLKWPKAKKGAK